MPTYDYVCDACKHSFELFQSMKDNPIKKCPKCGKLKARRLLGTGGGILFKGTGFYQTDYKSSKTPKNSKSNSDCSGNSGSCAKPDCGKK